MLALACGVGASAVAARALFAGGIEGSHAWIGIVLAVAAIACGRFPIRMGVGEIFFSLDSIPLVLGVMLLDTREAVALGAITATGALVGQPSLGGLRGWFWRAHIVATTALAMGAASLAATAMFAATGDTALRLLPAFLVALFLEALFDAFVALEIETEHPGGAREFLAGTAPMAANVVLPTFAAAAIGPYAGEPLVFTFVLVTVLVTFYGALWIANSQQREKRRGDRLKDTFSRYVPEGIVDDNLETMQKIELGGEQHELSVLFCDIRGFTSWSESRGPKEVIDELNVLLTELSASVMETGGTLDKFTGDGLMAFWGAPVPRADHAERACRAALDMLSRLDAVNQKRMDDGQEPFAIGVGVHSGPAVVGNVGHDRRLDYTAIGDTVNTAARLEGATKEIGAVLLASRATVDLLENGLRDRAMRIGDVSVKGKARPVEVWALQPLRPELDDIDDTFAA